MHSQVRHGPSIVQAMQFIRSLPVTVASYIATAFHRQITPPSRCSKCGLVEPFEALGYYARGITLGRRIVSLLVRRFRCSGCGGTASVLPSFAQPYRLVQNVTIHQYFETGVDETLPWQGILRNYWNRFVRWLPELRRVFIQSGRSPPFSTGPDAWQALRNTVGTLETITEFLVSEYQITPFGRYRCHEVPIKKAYR